MDRLGWAIFGAVIVVGSSTLLFWSRYKIQPLPAPQQQEKRVYEAHNRRCPDPVAIGSIPVILKPVDEPGKLFSVVRLPSQEMHSGDLEKWLQPIFVVRADRTIYVVDLPAVKEPHESSLVDLLMHYDFIDQICVIDPQNPPKWYPPPIPIHMRNGTSESATWLV